MFSSELFHIYIHIHNICMHMCPHLSLRLQCLGEPLFLLPGAQAVALHLLDLLLQLGVVSVLVACGSSSGVSSCSDGEKQSGYEV